MRLLVCTLSLLAARLCAADEPGEVTVRKGEDPQGLIPKTPKEILNAFYKDDGSAVLNLEERDSLKARSKWTLMPARTRLYIFTPR
jgi:hypothetical protein